MAPLRDFGPDGKLTTIKAAPARPAAATRKPMLGMQPSPSTPSGLPDRLDAFRGLAAGVSVYGTVVAIQHFVVFVGVVAPGLVPRYASEIVGVTAAVSTLLLSWLHLNAPTATATAPAPVPAQEEPGDATTVPTPPRLP